MSLLCRRQDSQRAKYSARLITEVSELVLICSNRGIDNQFFNVVVEAIVREKLVSPQFYGPDMRLQLALRISLRAFYMIGEYMLVYSKSLTCEIVDW